MQKEHNVLPNLIKNRFIVILSRASLNCFYIPFSDTFQKYKKSEKHIIIAGFYHIGKSIKEVNGFLSDGSSRDRWLPVF